MHRLQQTLAYKKDITINIENFPYGSSHHHILLFPPPHYNSKSLKPCSLSSFFAAVALKKQQNELMALFPQICLDYFTFSNFWYLNPDGAGKLLSKCCKIYWIMVGGTTYHCSVVTPLMCNYDERTKSKTCRVYDLSEQFNSLQVSNTISSIIYMLRERWRDQWSHEKQNKKPISVEFYHYSILRLAKIQILQWDHLLRVFEHKRPEDTMLRVVSRLKKRLCHAAALALVNAEHRLRWQFLVQVILFHTPISL